MIDKDLLISLEQSGIDDKVKVRFKDKLSYEMFVDFLDNNGKHNNYNFDENSLLYVVKNGNVLMYYTIENEQNVFIIEFLWHIIKYLKDDNNV